MAHAENQHFFVVYYVIDAIGPLDQVPAVQDSKPLVWLSRLREEFQLPPTPDQAVERHLRKDFGVL